MVEKGAATAAGDRRARGGRIPTPPSLLSRHPPSSRSPPPPASPPCWTRRPPAALSPSTCRRTARPLASKPGSRRTRPRSPAMTCCKQRWEEGEGRGERRERFRGVRRGVRPPNLPLHPLSSTPGSRPTRPKTPAARPLPRRPPRAMGGRWSSGRAAAKRAAPRARRSARWRRRPPPPPWRPSRIGGRPISTGFSGGKCGAEVGQGFGGIVEDAGQKHIQTLTSFHTHLANALPPPLPHRTGRPAGQV
jgi:hypothetical protein